MQQIAFMDEINFVLKGGSGRSGKLPDRLVRGFFVRVDPENIGRFGYISCKSDNKISYANIADIVSVRGQPVKRITQEVKDVDPGKPD